MASTNLCGQVLDEKYRIERQLGEGGMGAVYLATHLGTGRPVALKVIVPRLVQHDEFVERFKREARAAGRLRHPNVVDVTDFGFARLARQERVAYLVMEYLDGCTLAEVLAEEKRLPLSWVVDILEQACSALDEAHQQGIVHRDLKPDNIWLEPNRRGGYTVKVLDFGIAKLGDARTPETATTTPANLNTNAAPESDARLAPRGGSGEDETDVSGTGAANKADSPALSLKALGLAASSSSSSSSSAASSSSSSSTPSASTPSSSEAATLMQPEPARLSSSSPAATDAQEEAATFTDAPLALTEANTAADAHEEGTRMLVHRMTGHNGVASTAPAEEALTRVGSILGTPLYMSPEQCRGERSDARSDIYSLGVIAYQMLSGETPFKGDLSSIMKQHLEASPPPIKVKRVPRKAVDLLMSALAKNPAERPATAAAFSSALRAHAEGAGTLMRRAFALYSEHLPIFLRLALIIYAPLVVVNLLQLVSNYLFSHKLLPVWLGMSLSLLLSLASMLCAFVTASVNIGITTRLVTQLFAAPLRPLHIRPAFSVLKRRLRPILTTTLFVSILTLVGVFLGLIPGLLVMINYSLVTSVLMMEEKRGREAMRRAKELAARSRWTVTKVVFVQLFAPILTSIAVALIISAVIKALDVSGSKASTFSSIYQITFLPISIFIGSFGALLTALLYLKMRQAGGETPREVLGQFEEDEPPRRNWQLRMRERWHQPTRATRQGER